VSAVILGASMPPLGPAIRGSWAAVVPEEQLRTAYALDAVINESAVIVGPLLVTALVTVVPARFVMLIAGMGVACGILVLVLVRTRARGNAPELHLGVARRSLRGPLAHSDVPKVLGVVFFDTLAYGCLIVGITAVATAHHFAGAAGVLIAVLSAGVVISGLIYGAHPWNAHHRTILAALYAAGGLLFASGAYISDLVLLGAVLLVLGSVGGPRDALVQFVLGDAAPPEERTEAFAWLSTVTWLGYGLGTSLAGQLNGVGSNQAGTTFLAGAAASFVSAACCLTFRRKASAAGIPDQANASRA
jgi:MFS family permease